MNLNENINRIKQVMGILNESSDYITVRPKGDPYIYAKHKDSDGNDSYLAYKCGKNKPCPELDSIRWIDVTYGKYKGKPGYFKYENAIKKIIYNETGGNDLIYKIINKIQLTPEDLKVNGELNVYDSGLSNYTDEQLKQMVKPNGYINGPIVGAKR